MLRFSRLELRFSGTLRVRSGIRFRNTLPDSAARNSSSDAKKYRLPGGFSVLLAELYFPGLSASDADFRHFVGKVVHADIQRKSAAGYRKEVAVRRNRKFIREIFVDAS